MRVSTSYSHASAQWLASSSTMTADDAHQIVEFNAHVLEQAQRWAQAPGLSRPRRQQAYEALKAWIDKPINEDGNPQPLAFHIRGLDSLPPLPRGLTRLSVQGTSITELPELPSSLRKLTLTGNARLASLGANEFPNLRHLMLRGSAMQAISTPMPELEHAMLDGNRLRDISGLRTSSRLTYLDASRNQLTHLDDELFALPASRDGEDVCIDLKNNAFSDALERRIVERMKRPGYDGPRFFVSNAERFDELDTRTLDELVCAWSPAGTAPPTEWRAVSDEPHAGDFMSFLKRLENTVNADHLAFHDEVRAWLGELPQRPELRGLTFALAHEASTTCEDRVTLTYNQMHAARLLADAKDGVYNTRIPELVNLARSMFRADALDDIARDKVKQLTGMVDELEVHLGYQSKLGEKLDLPTVARSMAFFDGWSRLTDADLDAAERIVQTRENAEFGAHFAQWGAWHEVLKQIKPEALERAQESLSDALIEGEFDRRLERQLAELQLGDDADARRIQGVNVNRELGAEIYSTMTRDVLAALGHGDALDPPWPAPTLEQRVQEQRMNRQRDV